MWQEYTSFNFTAYMHSQTNVALLKTCFFLSLVSFFLPLHTFAAAAGRVEFTIGNVNAINSDDLSRTLTKGNEINAGDKIVTADGRVQLRFTDGGYISLQPNTEFKVNEYNFDGKADGTEKGVFSLLKGGLRAITGSIGHTNRKVYQVNTPVATIGIRGTEFLAQLDTKLLVSVGNGAVYLNNSAGDIIIYKGQSGEVGSQGEKPKQSVEVPSITAAGPTGGKPGDTQSQSQQQQEMATIFIAGDLKDESGFPCGISSSGGCESLMGNGPSTEAQILAANASGATGIWNGSSPFTVPGLGSGTAYGSLTVNFSTYTVSFVDLLASFSGGTYDGSSVHGTYYGSTPNSLSPDGTFSNVGSVSASEQISSGNPALCGSGGCVLTIHNGSIGGNHLGVANFTYSLNSISPGGLMTNPIDHQVVNLTGGLNPGNP